MAESFGIMRFYGVDASYTQTGQQTGSGGSYSYSAAADRANRPVNFVSWGDAARFTN